MAWAGTSSSDWAFSGFVALAHIQKQWGHQLIRSRLSSGEFAEWVCYWILGVGGKAVRLSFKTCGFTGSNMTMIQLPTNHWVLLYLGFFASVVPLLRTHELLVRDPSSSVIRHPAGNVVSALFSLPQKLYSLYGCCHTNCELWVDLDLSERRWGSRQKEDRSCVHQHGPITLNLLSEEAMRQQCLHRFRLHK